MKDPHNTFRHNDAEEYVNAYRKGLIITFKELQTKMRELSHRMGDAPPSYLLAAYRGYEAAYVFKVNGTLPGVVKLDDTDPTPVESLTPRGYEFVL